MYAHRSYVFAVSTPVPVERNRERRRRVRRLTRS
jgi:hypothetical protein